MTIYYAVVKHEANAEPAVKLAALRDGLREIACILVEEHGWDLERIRDEYEEAADSAEDSWDYVQRWKAEHPDWKPGAS